MSDTEQTKAKKEPTVLQALGVGSLIGLLLSLIILYPLTSEHLSLVFSIRLPGMFAIFLICITGSLIGRAKLKTFKGVWLGATIPLVVWGLLAILGTLLWPGY
jgi:uncharacterized integral membrane protein